MKNLLFLSMTLLFITNHSFAQKENNKKPRKLFCITTSCCSIGFATIEIWSETTCHYVDSNKLSLSFETEEDVKKIEILEDVLLAGQFNDNGDNLVLPKGIYDVANNEIDFIPSVYRAKKYCYIREVQGTFLGHDYDYSITICISFGRSSNKGVVVITPKLTKVQLAQITDSKDSSINFSKDTQIKVDNINFTLKAGKYIVNEDGNIYLQNVILK